MAVNTPLAEKSPAPTRKLSYASVSAVVLFLLSLVVEVDPQLEQGVNIVLPLVLAYFVKNADTPGGYSYAE
jgi:hypothetical protein